MHPTATTRRASVSRLAWLMLAASMFAGLDTGCGRRLDLPAEPDSDGGPAGEVAYVKKYAWDGLPALTDLVLTRGQQLYGIDPAGRVRSWFSDTATPRENTSRNLPVDVIVGPDTLRAPVQLCEGLGSTLWVAYSQPQPTLLQWNVGVVPPVPVDSGVVRDNAFRRFGGIAADPDSNLVYVADDSVSTITKYAPSRTGGHRIATLASQGNGDHFVQQPHGLFAFGDSLLVADTGKNWLQVLSSRVPFSGRGQVEGPIDQPLQMILPRDVWIDPTGFFYVTDTGNARVLKLTRQGRIKEIVTELDVAAADHPNTLAATDTKVWVVDPDLGRLTIYQLNTASEGLP